MLYLLLDVSVEKLSKPTLFRHFCNADTIISKSLILWRFADKLYFVLFNCRTTDTVFSRPSLELSRALRLITSSLKAFLSSFMYFEPSSLMTSDHSLHVYHDLGFHIINLLLIVKLNLFFSLLAQDRIQTSIRNQLVYNCWLTHQDRHSKLIHFKLFLYDTVFAAFVGLKLTLRVINLLLFEFEQVFR